MRNPGPKILGHRCPTISEQQLQLRVGPRPSRTPKPTHVRAVLPATTKNVITGPSSVGISSCAATSNWTACRGRKPESAGTRKRSRFEVPPRVHREFTSRFLAHNQKAPRPADFGRGVQSSAGRDGGIVPALSRRDDEADHLKRGARRIHTPLADRSSTRKQARQEKQNACRSADAARGSPECSDGEELPTDWLPIIERQVRRGSFS